MAIYRLIASGHFGPDEIEAMTKAYEAALIGLRTIGRNDPLTEIIAKSVVNVTATGERDPEIISKRALNALGIRKAVAA
jgi:hypothetical protein